MNEIEKIIKQVLTTKGVNLGIETALDLGEGMVVSKSTAKKLRAKKKGCHKENNKEKRRYCIPCPFYLGSEECKEFKELNDMKFALFPSIPEEMGKLCAT